MSAQHGRRRRALDALCAALLAVPCVATGAPGGGLGLALRVSVPIGDGHCATPRFRFGVDHDSARSTHGRELIAVRLMPGVAPRLELGGRLAWDAELRRFAAAGP